MTRKKVVSLVLVMVLVLAVLVAPLAVAAAARSGTALQLGQAPINSLPIGIPHATPVLACDGCSGGGGGPT